MSIIGFLTFTLGEKENCCNAASMSKRCVVGKDALSRYQRDMLSDKNATWMSRFLNSGLAQPNGAHVGTGTSSTPLGTSVMQGMASYR